MNIEDIPSNVFEGYIKRINEKRGIPIEKVMSEFEKILKSEKVQRQSAADEEKAKYAARIVYNRFMSKEPVTAYSMVIPFGVTDARVTVSGKRASVFAALKTVDGKGFEIKEIVHKGEYASIPQNLELLRAYKNVKLYDKGYFIEVGDETRYNNPQKVKMTEEDFITRILKYSKLKNIADVVTHESRRDVSGYTDRYDMFLLEGMVVRKSDGTRKDKTLFALYEIKDESLEYEEKAVRVGNKEVIIPQTLTVWIPIRFLRWDEDSELAFLGTITIGQDKKPSMNAVLVYPAGFVCEIPQVEKKKKEKKK